jgi:hypothetical protein
LFGQLHQDALGVHSRSIVPRQILHSAGYPAVSLRIQHFRSILGLVIRTQFGGEMESNIRVSAPMISLFWPNGTTAATIQVPEGPVHDSGADRRG